MYKISEFSILVGITVKTLRYYDKINLFKPAITDKHTGYRYYDEKQIETLINILRYKDLGFSLSSIKKLMKKDNSNEIINNQINALTEEIIKNERKINNLKNMLQDNITNAEYKPYQQKYIIGKRFTIKSREEIEKRLEEINKELKKLNIYTENPIFCNFELSYVEENIDCFIGYTISEIPKEAGSLEIIFKSPIIKQLVGIGKKDNIDNIYKNMIKYAHDNKIQIRGFFTEVYKENEVEIYVEAFDLKEENEDYIHFLNHYKKTKELDEDLIGTFEIREILPNAKYMLNPNKQKNTLDTNFKILVLKEDGTTNYKNINWNKKYLLMEYDDIIIPLPIHKRTYKNKLYLQILMNESYEYYKSQRPMDYIYEKKSIK